jgi:hypothetical protein
MDSHLQLYVREEEEEILMLDVDTHKSNSFTHINFQLVFALANGVEMALDD